MTEWMEGEKDYKNFDKKMWTIIIFLMLGPLFCFLNVINWLVIT
jgi:hypothetical protein